MRSMETRYFKKEKRKKNWIAWSTQLKLESVTMIDTYVLGNSSILGSCAATNAANLD